MAISVNWKTRCQKHINGTSMFSDMVKHIFLSTLARFWTIRKWKRLSRSTRCRSENFSFKSLMLEHCEMHKAYAVRNGFRVTVLSCMSQVDSRYFRLKYQIGVSSVFWWVHIFPSCKLWLYVQMWSDAFQYIYWSTAYTNSPLVSCCALLYIKRLASL